MAIGEDSPESTKRWDGYSDYREVSSSIVRAVDDATDAEAAIRARHLEGARVTPSDAAQARSAIIGAAHRLRHEVVREADHNDKLDEIAENWTGSEDDPGRLNRMSDVRLRDEAPGWLSEFVDEIRTAAWELGYIQAGRTETEYTGDPHDGEIMEMLEDM